ncbi:hypothetical protein V1527DRAFT_46016 [Lipomyces starkeyi]
MLAAPDLDSTYASLMSKHPTIAVRHRDRRFCIFALLMCLILELFFFISFYRGFNPPRQKIALLFSPGHLHQLAFATLINSSYGNPLLMAFLGSVSCATLICLENAQKPRRIVRVQRSFARHNRKQKINVTYE